MSDSGRGIINRLRAHPLYDVAMVEIIEALPPELEPDHEVPLEDVREMLILCWLRGVAWRDEHRDLPLGG